ncbi:O-antigen ligase family protein [Flavobacterium sp. NKUCC04_CG]|uniref:O-antigen ligase family protein n=1 Tax=Flavobacterium sp. NKUCC04_CG TaxID=2842121 RepID=UPI001C5BF59A|nr:O-antigen ligase family protein [Flavobacterium sp. NKUCC04_CG]MBW3518882.1 O-antigen ligase family protein [Flavobacterium sp. NKUCC04_CG]
MVIKIKVLNYLILIMLIPVLIVDMLNGFLLGKQINLPISVSQLYKIVIIGLMLCRFLVDFAVLRLIGALFFILLLGSLVRFTFYDDSFSILFDDSIKIFKYLTPLISFVYFREIMYLNDSILLDKYIKWIKISYAILAVNLLLKIVGLGYPMYEEGTIGTRGYFYAGNEISALLLVLSVILGYYYWEIKINKLKFIFCLISSLILGFLISSKTGMVGIVLVFVLIAFNPRKINFAHKNFRKSLIIAASLFPIFIWSAYNFVVNSAIITRFTHFWTRMDFLTFILSSRNTYFEMMIPIYQEQYSWIEKVIGGGQTYYEELLGKIIEIDLLDIFFAYGYVGAILFILLIGILLIFAKGLINKKEYPYARLSYFMIIVLVLISCLSGHVFNSGIAGIFIGFLFSLMFFKKSNVTCTERQLD